MERRVRLFWDFRDPQAPVRAGQFLERLESYPLGDLRGKTAGRRISDRHWVVTLTLPESAVKAVRDTLKPHRGELLPVPENE